MARIAFFDLEPWEEAYFSKRLARHALSFFPTKIHDSRLGKAAKADAIAAFIFSPVNGPTIKRFPNLKLVTTMSTGFDHIDLVECRKRGITACNVPAYGDNTVAEHAFALLLAIARKLPESVDRTRRGNFSREGLRGFDLKGKTIGIVGTGKIGKHAARIAHGFQMAVLAYDPFPDHALEAELGMQYVTLEKLLAESDIVTLHAPLTAKTKHIIGAKALSRTKHGLVLINTSRGGLIDTRALLRALENGHVGYAGLDVLEEEDFIREEKELLSKNFRHTADFQTVLEDHALLSHPRVIVTPHTAFNSQEALERILETTAENIEAFLAGKPKNVVSLPPVAKGTRKRPAATRKRRRK